jgi:hypothetical protein
VFAIVTNDHNSESPDRSSFSPSSSSSSKPYTPILRYSNGSSAPVLKDDFLSAEVIADGLDLPTTMAFVGPDDILVLS